MAYATLADVQRLYPIRAFTANSTPATDDVKGFLEDTYAELNGALAAQNYAIPVATTAAQSFRLVERWNAIGAHCLAEEAAPDSPVAERARKEWDAILMRLSKGEVVLPDLDRDTTQLQLRVRSAATPFFFRDMTL